MIHNIKINPHKYPSSVVFNVFTCTLSLHRFLIRYRELFFGVKVCILNNSMSSNYSLDLRIIDCAGKHSRKIPHGQRVGEKKLLPFYSADFVANCAFGLHKNLYIPKNHTKPWMK